MDITKTMTNLASRAGAISHFEEGDYFSDDGLLMCGKCHTAKQCRVEVFDSTRVVPCLCMCEQERQERERIAFEKKQRMEECERNRRAGFPESKMQTWTFANDDLKNPQLTRAMKNYVEHFDDFRQSGKGLILYGDVDGGKTYAACEVANALIDDGIPVLVTNFTRLANTVQGMFDGKQQYLDSLNRYPLLVLDDLSAERETEYMQEIVYNIIDSRVLSGRPMIITTNLTGDELKNPDTMTKKRIYSRVLEVCHPIKVETANRRRETLKRDHATMREILGM